MRRTLSFLPLVLLLAGAATPPAPAQFFQLVNPGGIENPTIEKTYKEGFVDVFGPRPFGPRDRKMVQRQMIWDAEHERFGKIEDFLDAVFPVEALLLYQEIGIGFPVQWRRANGQRFVAFPEARYSKFHYVPVELAKQFPGKVWRDYHLDSVQKGFCVSELDANFPGFVKNQNASNCASGPAQVGVIRLLIADWGADTEIIEVPERPLFEMCTAMWCGDGTNDCNKCGPLELGSAVTLLD